MYLDLFYFENIHSYYILPAKLWYALIAANWSVKNHPVIAICAVK